MQSHATLRPGVRRVLALLVVVASLYVAGGCRAEEPDGSAEAGKESTMVAVRVFNEKGELVGPVQSPKVVKTDEEWKKQLTKEQYLITRGSGTERPFCGTLLDNKREGVYACVCCGLPLFSSSAKFKSGTGWPSFFQPIAPENVAEKADRSLGMVRTEINCARCDAHLGHVFNDGPRPTGLRFCLNSESLTFTDLADVKKLADPLAEKAGKLATAVSPAAASGASRRSSRSSRASSRRPPATRAAPRRPRTTRPSAPARPATPRPCASATTRARSRTSSC